MILYSDTTFEMIYLLKKVLLCKYIVNFQNKKYICEKSWREIMSELAFANHTFHKYQKAKICIKYPKGF